MSMSSASIPATYKYLQGHFEMREWPLSYLKYWHEQEAAVPMKDFNPSARERRASEITEEEAIAAVEYFKQFSRVRHCEISQFHPVQQRWLLEVDLFDVESGELKGEYSINRVSQELRMYRPYEPAKEIEENVSFSDVDGDDFDGDEDFDFEAGMANEVLSAIEAARASTSDDENDPIVEFPFDYLDAFFAHFDNPNGLADGVTLVGY